MKKNLLLMSGLALLVLASCSKDDVAGPVVAPAKGVYVLSEGAFNGSNAKFGFYSFATNTMAGDFFVQQNPTIPAGVGGLATDMVIYGTKLYVVVDQSHKVTVLNAKDAKFIKDIPFTDIGGSPAEPRYATVANGNVFVTTWDGTVRVIDTSSLAITKSIPVGLNPEGLVVIGSNLYVANSGGLTATFDSTVSVINLATLSATSKIHVGKNPTSITADESGNFYVATQGNYGAIPPRLVKVNTTSNTVVKSADTTVGVVKYYNNALYVTGGYSGVQNVRKLNTTNFAAMAGNFVTDGTVVSNPYSININEENGDVYVTDAKNNILAGEFFCFSRAGKKKFSSATTPGVNPNKVVFVR